MYKWEEGSVLSNNTRLHYYRTGGNKPALVLLHGITDDGLCWAPYTKALEDRFDVIMVDQRGHGKSDAPDEGWDYKTMAREIAGLIKALELDRPIVQGHSMGALTALVLLCLFPDLARGYILEDPPPFWMGGPKTQEDLESDLNMIKRFEWMKRQTKEGLFNFAREVTPDWSEEEFCPWVDAKQRFSYKITRLLKSDQSDIIDWYECSGQVQCPILLITADQKLGAILGDSEVSELRKIFPELFRVHIPGAGHNIRREKFSKYIEAVKEFTAGQFNIK